MPKIRTRLAGAAVAGALALTLPLSNVMATLAQWSASGTANYPGATVRFGAHATSLVDSDNQIVVVAVCNSSVVGVVVSTSVDCYMVGSDGTRHEAVVHLDGNVAIAAFRFTADPRVCYTLYVSGDFTSNHVTVTTFTASSGSCQMP